MKIKKIVSLVLVLAMVVSVFSTLTVAAAGTANLGFTIYEADGTTEVKGNLEVGKIYYASIALSDISAKKVKTAQITANYNTDVIDLVNESGEVATDYDVVIERTDIYDPKYNKNGVFEVMELKTANGMIDYTISIAKEMDASLKETGVDCDGTYEIIKVRFKTKKNGKIGFGIATSELGEGKYNQSNANGVIFTNPDAVEVTTVACNARVGDVTFTKADYRADLGEIATFVVNSVKVDDVYDILNKHFSTIEVAFTNDDGDELVKELPVKHSTDDFDATKVGTYTFTGTVDTSSVTYKGAAVQVKATVTIQPLTVTSIITSVVGPTVREGDPAPVKPSKVQAYVNAYSIYGGYEIYDLDVVWSEPVDDVTNPNKKVSTYTGTVTGTSNITVPDALKTLTFVVTTLKESTTTEIGENTNVEEIDLNIDAAEIKPAGDVITVDDVKKQLPDFVELDDGFVNVDDWTIAKVNGEEVPEGYEYKVGDVLEFAPVFASGITMTKNFTAQVSAVIPAGKKNPPVFTATGATVETKTDAGYTIAKAIEDSGISGKYEDGTVIKASDIKWAADTTPAFDAKVAGIYMLRGTWADAYGHSENFDIEIVVEQSGADDFYFATDKFGKKKIENDLKMVTGLVTADVYVFFTPEDADDEIVNWETTDAKVVEIIKKNSDSVRIRTTNKKGEAIIIATAKSGLEKSFKVKVAYATIEEDDKGSYGAGGGSGSGGSYSILAQAVEEAEAQNAAQNSVFGDLAGFEWAATQIDTLRLLGIVSGKSAVSYAPADSVTRAEYLAMLVRLLNLQANGEAKTFTDVNPGDWFYDVVNVASSLGIAYGYENGAFDPNAVIKRQDMAVFAKRAIDVAGLKPLVGVSSTFEDQADIAPYALDAVLFMTSIGAINGMGDGTFKPLETANRAQAAVVIYNIYSIKNN